MQTEYWSQFHVQLGSKQADHPSLLIDWSGSDQSRGIDFHRDLGSIPDHFWGL